MRTRFVNKVFVGVMAVGVAMFAADSSFAQGKGKGGGKGDGGGKHHGGGNGGGGGKHDKGDRGGGGGNKHDRGYMGAPQMPQQVWAQQNNGRGNGRGNGNGNGNGKWKGDRGQRQNVYVQQGPQIIYQQPSYQNYGQMRKAQVHERNAQRKAEKNQEKFWKQQEKAFKLERRNNDPARYYAPTYQQPYYQPRSQQLYEPRYEPRYGYRAPQTYSPQYAPNYGYAQPYSGYSQPNYDPYYSGAYNDSGGFSGKDLIRNLIFSVLGANNGFGGQNDDYYSYQSVPVYGIPYAQPVSYNSQPNYGYGGYSDPYYVGGYQPTYGGDPYYYGASSGIFPMDDIGLGGGAGDFVRQMFSRLLAVGYTQGFNDGIAARALPQSRRFYDDPYDYDQYSQAVYDPYSVSLGDNRRCLAQGYELGYEDALANNRSSYGAFENGDVDLVSVLLSSVSQIL